MTERPPSALQRALIDVEQHRMEPVAFLARLSATEVFVPTQPSDNGEAVTAESDGFALITLEVDGADVLPMFDGFARFQEWAGDASVPIGYMTIEAGALLAAIDPGITVALFAGDDGFCMLDRDMLDALRNPGVEMLDGMRGFAPGARLQIGIIEETPDGLIAAMIPALDSRSGEVLLAWLITVGDPDHLDDARLTVALALSLDSDDLFQSVIADVASVATAFLDGDDVIEFVNVTDSDLGEALRRETAPFFAWDGG